ECQKGAAVHREHGDADEPGEKAEGIEEAQEPALVGDAERVVEMEGHAEEEIAEGDPEDERWYDACHEEGPIPGAAPRPAFELAAERDGGGAEDEGHEHQEHREIEAGEGDRIDRRPGCERGPAAKHEPHLVALPDRPDDVEQHAPL